MPIRDNIDLVVSGGGGDLPSDLAAITVEISAQTGIITNVDITAVICTDNHEYSNNWSADNGITTTLYLNKNAAETVTIKISASGFKKTQQTVSAVTQTVTFEIEEAAMTALVFLSDNTVWKTNDGLEYEQVSDVPFAVTSQAKLYRSFNGTVVVARLNNYAYSTDEGSTWTQLSSGSWKTLNSVRKINDEYYFIGTLNQKTGSYYKIGYYKTSDISVAPTNYTQVQVQYTSNNGGDLQDLESDGTNFRGIKTNRVGYGSVYSNVGGYDIVYGNGVWVIRGTSKIYYSTDLSSWTQATLPTLSKSFSAVTNHSLYFVNDEFICVGQYGIVLKSSDGINWIAINDPGLSDNPFFGVGQSGIIGIRYSSSKFYVSVSNDFETFESEQEVAGLNSSSVAGVIVIN